MRRSVLGAVSLLMLAVFAWPVHALAASSGKVIYTFQGGADGSEPYSDLTLDASGNLYGTTVSGGIGCNGYGCGTVYELVRGKNSWQHQVLYSFNNNPDGADPEAGVIFDSAGNLYGTTSGGGNIGCGTVYKLAPNSQGGWIETILYSFSCTNAGGFPRGDLVFDSQGNLYGTTFAGAAGTGFCGGDGFFGCGTAFKLSPNSDGSWTETTIYNFQGAPDAAIPYGALVPDGKGGFYGAAEYGGSGACSTGHGIFDPPDGCSAVFELTPSGAGWTEAVIYSFFRGRGFAKIPSGGFVVGGPNLLFGASTSGGNGLGTLFRLDQTGKTWTQSILHRFSGNPDGRAPVGRLVKGPQDTWIGVTNGGGASHYGTVFAVEPNKSGFQERVLFNIDGSIGNPESGPVVDSQGHVYGTAVTGAGGNVYEVIP